MASVFKTIRGKLVAGFVTIAPIAITIWVLKLTYNFFDKPARPFLEKYLPVYIPGLSVIITLVMVFLLGVLVTNYLGRRLIHWGEIILDKIPVANTVYSTVKQITNALTGTRSRAFQKTILFEYPRKGLWTIAFVTGEAKAEDGNDYYYLFVPTTPNPTSGYMIMVKQDEAIEAGLSVEEGLKAIISGGVLAPESSPIK